jgi:hypothetical protein
MVKEVKKYRTTDGKEFDAKWKAESYEEIFEIVKRVSNIFGMGGFHKNYFKEIIENRKELGNYLLEIKDFDPRGLDLFFGEKKKY